MFRSRLLVLMLSALLALSLAACIERVSVDDDGAVADSPVPTPAPAEAVEDDDDDEVVDAEPDPTPAPTETDDSDADLAAIPGADGDEWFGLLETDKTYPEDETGEQIIELAESEAEFDDLRERFELEEIAASEDIDWEQHVVLFVGTGESSSCPLELVDVVFDEDERLIDIQASREGPADIICTMDWTPRVFVIALERGVLGEDELYAVITDPEMDAKSEPEQRTTIR